MSRNRRSLAVADVPCVRSRRSARRSAFLRKRLKAVLVRLSAFGCFSVVVLRFSAAVGSRIGRSSFCLVECCATFCDCLSHAQERRGLRVCAPDMPGATTAPRRRGRRQGPSTCVCGHSPRGRGTGAVVPGGGRRILPTLLADGSGRRSSTRSRSIGRRRCGCAFQNAAGRARFPGGSSVVRIRRRSWRRSWSGWRAVLTGWPERMNYVTIDRASARVQRLVRRLCPPPPRPDPATLPDWCRDVTTDTVPTVDAQAGSGGTGPQPAACGQTVKVNAVGGREGKRRKTPPARRTAADGFRLSV